VVVVWTAALLLIWSGALSAAEFTFAVISDPHVAVNKPEHNGRFAKALERAGTFDPAFIVITGDLLENWSEDSASLYSEMTENYPVPIHLVPGNHDVGQKRTPDGKGGITSDAVKRWKKVFDTDRFAFEYEGCLFIGINNVLLASGLPEEARQEEWFHEKIRETGDRRVFVICHYPFFLRHSGETEGGYWTVESPARDRWLHLFVESGVSAVWNGHLHRFNEAVWKGVSFIATPGTSFSCAADKGLTGFRVVRVTDDGWQHEFIDLRTKGVPPLFGPAPSAPKEASGNPE
jgi:3',5'-cyclic AMP phosphodiesterase CpdA